VQLNKSIFFTFHRFICTIFTKKTGFHFHNKYINQLTKNNKHFDRMKAFHDYILIKYKSFIYDRTNP